MNVYEYQRLCSACHRGKPVGDPNEWEAVNGVWRCLECRTFGREVETTNVWTEQFERNTKKLADELRRVMFPL